MNSRPATARASGGQPRSSESPDWLPTPPALSIVHSLPGRTRLRVPALTDCESPDECERFLAGISGVNSVQIRIHARSILIMHDRELPGPEVARQIAASLGGRIPGRRAPVRAAVQPGIDTNPAADCDWHAKTIERVVSDLGSSNRDGLSATDANDRLQHFGPNRLEESPPPGAMQYLARQVATAPVALLAGSAVVSIVSGGVADAIGIGAAIVINTLIGAATEQQSEKTIRMLSRRQSGGVRVVRDGQARLVSGAELVPGDLLLLSPGDVVPADARLVVSDALSIDESALTGESLPVWKSAGDRYDADTPLADRGNMVFGGTTVTGGSGRAVVVATGYATEVGRIQRAAESAAAPETAMQRQLNELGGQLTAGSVAACAAVLGIGLLRGGPAMELLKTAISLGVAAVPEGLPAVATTTLALGVRRMRRRDLLIRNINAVETLGSVQTVCLDKTGTLTENRMAPAAVHVGMESLRIERETLVDADGREAFRERPELDALLLMISLCNDSTVTSAVDRKFDGAATENALLELALLGGLSVDIARAAHPRLETSYRTENRPWMYTVHSVGKRVRLLVVKGSPAEVLHMCGRLQLRGRRIELTDDLRERILAANEAWAGDSLRVLGVACGRHRDDQQPVLENLTWVGLVGVADPLRQGMRDMIDGLHTAGVSTVMITGDQMGTAAAIGRQLELSNDGPLRVLDSRDLSKLDPELLDALVGKTHVFARVSPANKLQIVRALQRSGRVVAMTGDGVNDGPALKAADVGIAMGQAQNDVARSVADVVVKENRLESVIEALAQGRTTYSNVRKSLHYLISTNLSEIEVMLGASLVGMETPLTPMQLLWINLVTDALPALALALEPAEASVMQAPPRDSRESILPKERLWRMLRESGVMTAGTLGSLAYGRLRYGPGASARSMAFNTLTMAQLLHSLSCRSERYLVKTSERERTNPALLAAVGGSLALQALVVFVPPLRRLLQAGRLTWTDLLVSGLFAAGPMLINEILKPVPETAHTGDQPTSTTGAGE